MKAQDANWTPLWAETLPGVTAEEFDAALLRVVRAALDRNPATRDVQASLSLTSRFIAGSAMDQAHPAVSVLRSAAADAAGPEFRTHGAPFACDANMFKLHSSMPALVVGPGDGGAHGPDEYVDTADLVDLARHSGAFHVDLVPARGRLTTVRSSRASGVCRHQPRSSARQRRARPTRPASHAFAGPGVAMAPAPSALANYRELRPLGYGQEAFYLWPPPILRRAEPRRIVEAGGQRLSTCLRNVAGCRYGLCQDRSLTGEDAMQDVIEVVNKGELRRRRQILLGRARTDWFDLRQRAGKYALTDDERGIYDAIRGIDWMLSQR